MKLKNTKRNRPIPYSKEDKAFLLNLGRRINHLRNVNKLTQEELSEMSGLHRGFICTIEKGRQNPSLLCLYHISKALDISLSELLAATMESEDYSFYEFCELDSRCFESKEY